jgi:hypothetical protein
MEQLELFDKPDPTEGFLDGIKVLLARMSSNPEDFSTNHLGNGWHDLVTRVYAEHAATVFTLEEIHAIKQKHREVRRNNFSSEVLSQLMQKDAVSSDYAQKSSAIPTGKFLKDAKALLMEHFDSQYKTP